MHSRTIAILTALALVPPALALGQAAEDALAPPPGTPQEVELWRRGQQVGEAVVGARAQAGRLQQRVMGERMLERLERQAAAAPPEAAAPLRALRERLLDRWTSNYQILARPWPVDPTRVCWYQMLTFDGAVRRVPHIAAELGEAREALATCVERAGAAARTLDEANRALAERIDEAVKALPPPGSSSPDTSSSAAAGSP